MPYRQIFRLTRALVAAAGAGLCLAAAADDGPRFAIRSFAVSGNRLLDAAEIERAVAPWLGEDRAVADIQAAVQAVRGAYAGKGYRAVAVSLPEQAVDSGVVRIRVVEYRIDKVTVDAPEGMDVQRVAGWFPMLEPGQPLDFNRLGRALDAINESPALAARVDLAPGAAADAQAARVVLSEQDPVAWYAGLDDSGNGATGHHRLSVGVRDANLLSSGQSLSAQYTTSPEKSSRVSVWGLGWRMPLPAYGMALEAYAGHSDVDSGSVASIFTVAGKGSVAGAKATWMLDRADAWRQKLSLGIDYRSYQNAVYAFGIKSSVVPDYIVHPWSLGYEISNGANNAYVTLVQGFGGGGKASDAQIALARTGARAAYTVVRYGAAWGMPLAAGWGLDANLSGQVANRPLVPGEQFGLGGAQNLRGFEERFVADDVGHRAALQLWTPGTEAAGAQLRGLVFVDVGRVKRMAPQPGEQLTEGLSSAGFGARAALGRHVLLAADLGRVLQGTAARPAGELRGHVALQFRF
jgi:hemolysin activation/secretion protein